MDVMTRSSVFGRLGGKQQCQHYYVKNDYPVVVCKYWLAGKCNRNPCRFLHSNSPISQPKRSTWTNPNLSSSSSSKNNPKVSSSSSSGGGGAKEESKFSRTAELASDCGASGEKGDQKKLCKYWITGNCVHGDKCNDLHTWFLGSRFSPLTKLERRHNKAVAGIALPSGSDKLFPGSRDGPNEGREIGCLITEGSWVFVGLHNAIKAWNIQTQTEVTLPAVGLVKAMVVGGDSNEILFGGVQDGTILAWKYSSCCTESMATRKGHRLAVLSLIVGANNRLYSGSKDETIRVWDIRTFQCLQTLKGQTDFVTSLSCWNQYLLSGSLDNTIKVWASIDDEGNIGVIHEVKEESGIIALGGIEDAIAAKHILLCSYKDNSVRPYELPFLAERGRIFSKAEVETVQRGYGDLFFTGDATGEVSVWKLLDEQTTAADCASI
ncbi:unnamed protein product [Coffea canephora]|uniref:C3H1-type domain-containing protein n=1 Tax=Coffea canephora TaxID=49390 RepID=A0A068UH91_COFCA|nr:unnamed protein product [Coffea canephora]